MDNIRSFVTRLIAYTSEEDWFEFKDSWYDATGIGEYISSMSNAAAMCGKENAYIIWGIDNDTHELTNTSFNYSLFGIAYSLKSGYNYNSKFKINRELDNSKFKGMKKCKWTTNGWGYDLK